MDKEKIDSITSKVSEVDLTAFMLSTIRILSTIHYALDANNTPYYADTLVQKNLNEMSEIMSTFQFGDSEHE